MEAPSPMSEPDAAFLKLEIARADLVAWLDDRPPPASNWRDWRDIGGEYQFDAGRGDIADISELELNRHLADCDAQLSRFATNREALRELFDPSENPFLIRVAYDSERRLFVAGSLAYSENLYDFIVFLTVARGAAARLATDGHGLAVIHNYIWGRPAERTTAVALRLGPGPRSEFMAVGELASAGGAFQPIADEIMNAKPFPPPAHIELDTLK
jgi:hypothetical protein